MRMSVIFILFLLAFLITVQGVSAESSNLGDLITHNQKAQTLTDQVASLFYLAKSSPQMAITNYVSSTPIIFAKDSLNLGKLKDNFRQIKGIFIKPGYWGMYDKGSTSQESFPGEFSKGVAFISSERGIPSSAIHELAHSEFSNLPYQTRKDIVEMFSENPDLYMELVNRLRQKGYMNLGSEDVVNEALAYQAEGKINELIDKEFSEQFSKLINLEVYPLLEERAAKVSEPKKQYASNGESTTLETSPRMTPLVFGYGR